jgi:hypothetical protein
LGDDRSWPVLAVPICVSYSGARQEFHETIGQRSPRFSKITVFKTERLMTLPSCLVFPDTMAVPFTHAVPPLMWIRGASPPAPYGPRLPFTCYFPVISLLFPDNRENNRETFYLASRFDPASSDLTRVISILRAELPESCWRRCREFFAWNRQCRRGLIIIDAVALGLAMSSLIKFLARCPALVKREGTPQRYTAKVHREGTPQRYTGIHPSRRMRFRPKPVMSR